MTRPSSSQSGPVPLRRRDYAFRVNPWEVPTPEGRIEQALAGRIEVIAISGFKLIATLKSSIAPAVSWRVMRTRARPASAAASVPFNFRASVKSCSAYSLAAASARARPRFRNAIALCSVDEAALVMTAVHAAIFSGVFLNLPHASTGSAAAAPLHNISAVSPRRKASRQADQYGMAASLEDNHQDSACNLASFRNPVLSNVKHRITTCMPCNSDPLARFTKLALQKVLKRRRESTDRVPFHPPQPGHGLLPPLRPAIGNRALTVWPGCSRDSA